MSCKTEIYKVLAESLTALNEKGSSQAQNSQFKVINPKSLTMVQLYGWFDSSTHEWTDGVLGRTYRDMATSNSDERKWIVFDGPLDSSWMENLNTVLDDSKKLCLMNGEIIPLSKKMTILFEISDMRKASPAVVGRASFVYMESNMLGNELVKFQNLQF